MAQPYPMPQRQTSGLKSLAEAGIVIGIVIAVVGGVALIYRECTRTYFGNCVQWEYPFTSAGIAAVIVGIVALILSVVILLFAHGQDVVLQQATQVGFPCPSCNRPMVWIHQYQRWFCQYCQKYA